VVARRVGSTDIWSVGFIDQDGRQYLGANQYVGPDGIIWRFSSSPEVHDYHLVERVLTVIYQRGLADRVHEEALRDRIRTLTEDQDRAIRQLAEEAVSGALLSPRE
jgi:hypothetical protein